MIGCCRVKGQGHYLSRVKAEAPLTVKVCFYGLLK